MKELETILSKLRRVQPDLKARYSIKDIGVFGSYVRGEQTPDSDLDLLIELGPGLTLIDLARMKVNSATTWACRSNWQTRMPEAPHREGCPSEAVMV